MRWGIFVDKIRDFYKTPEGIATEKGSNISEKHGLIQYLKQKLIKLEDL